MFSFRKPLELDKFCAFVFLEVTEFSFKLCSVGNFHPEIWWCVSSPKKDTKAGLQQIPQRRQAIGRNFRRADARNLAARSARKKLVFWVAGWIRRGMSEHYLRNVCFFKIIAMVCHTKRNSSFFPDLTPKRRLSYNKFLEAQQQFVTSVFFLFAAI